MSRGKEVKELREKMGMNRREFSDYYGSSGLGSGEKRTSGLSVTFIKV